MLCEKCKKRIATVFYNKSSGGRARSYSLCGECTAKQREKDDIHVITSLISNSADQLSDKKNFGEFQ